MLERVDVNYRDTRIFIPLLVLIQGPPPLPQNFNEIDLIYQSHLIYSEIRICFYTLICQSVCDQCVTEGGLLCSIERIETQDQGPGTLDRGPCALDLGPLVIEW